MSKVVKNQSAVAEGTRESTVSRRGQQHDPNPKPQTLPVCGHSIAKTFMSRMKPPCKGEGIVPAAALMFHICMLNSVLERAGNRAAERHDLTFTQWMALGCIANGGQEGVTHTELGNRLMLSKAPITGMVDRLERDGHVHRKMDEADRRVSRILITPKGEETWRLVRQELRELAIERCSCLTDEELQTMLGLLARLLDSAASADPILSRLKEERE